MPKRIKSTKKSETLAPETLAYDVMSSDLVVLQKSQTFREAIELLTRERLTVLPVVDSRGKLLGLLTEKEVLEACKAPQNSGKTFLDLPIRYTRKVETAQPSTPVRKIRSLLASAPFRHLPIVDERKILKGIITRRDLIRLIYLRLELQTDLQNEI